MERHKREKGEPELYEKYELDALNSERPQSMAVFYNVSTKIAAAESKEAVWTIYDKAMDNLAGLFGSGKEAREDYSRMDLLLLRRAWERIKTLDENQSEGVEELRSVILNKNEQDEIDSLNDKSMVTMAREVFKKLILKMDSSSPEQVMVVFNAGRSLMFRIYDKSAFQNDDFIKWDMLLAQRLSAFVQRWKSGNR